MSKRLTVFAIIVLILSIFFTFAIQYNRFLIAPLSKTETIHYIFEPGSSVHRLVDDLQARGFITHPDFFFFLAYWKGATNKLKTGEYLFAPGTTPNQLLDQMLEGNVILHRFTIVEGWTFQQLMTALNALAYVKHRLNQVSPEQVLTNLGLPQQNPEGLFFPATYDFSLGTKDTDLLKWSYQLLEKKLNQEWRERARGLPYKTPYEALIAASLVERETALPKEKAMIAGVITRRLEKGIPLQIDASIIYGLGAAYTGKLTMDDLRKDTPYNTYTRRGLPPTPIAIPSLISIDAILHPDHSKNLYFVAKGDGSHQFSSNLAQHNMAVRIYQVDKHYPNVGKKSRCSSLWYISKTMQSLFCRVHEK
ncbi:MAG: endolytic transglycosylase MltG [Pseudomonadota bacterium]